MYIYIYIWCFSSREASDAHLAGYNTSSYIAGYDCIYR